jgi:hypothetical protein
MNYETSSDSSQCTVLKNLYLQPPPRPAPLLKMRRKKEKVKIDKGNRRNYSKNTENFVQVYQ